MSKKQEYVPKTRLFYYDQKIDLFDILCIIQIGFERHQTNDLCGHTVFKFLESENIGKILTCKN